MVWMNLKPEARQYNVFCAMILGTGTLLVHDFHLRMAHLEQVVHEGEAAEEQEEEEETRLYAFICNNCGTMFKI